MRSQKPQSIYNSLNSTTIAVASTATVYSKAFSLRYGVSFGLELLAASDVAVDVLVYLEEGNQKPTTEGSADTTWVVGEGVSDVINLTTETTKIIPISPNVAMFGRLKLTGQGSNDASTTITGKIVKLEQL